MRLYPGKLVPLSGIVLARGGAEPYRSPGSAFARVKPFAAAVRQQRRRLCRRHRRTRLLETVRSRHSADRTRDARSDPPPPPPWPFFASRPDDRSFGGKNNIIVSFRFARDRPSRRPKNTRLSGIITSKNNTIVSAMDRRPPAENWNFGRRRQPETAGGGGGGNGGNGQRGYVGGGGGGGGDGGCDGGGGGGGGDRTDVAVQMNEEDLLPPPMLVPAEHVRPPLPSCRDQMIQVPAPRMPSNTKRCVLTMDGYSYVIGECRSTKHRLPPPPMYFRRTSRGKNPFYPISPRHRCCARSRTTLFSLGRRSPINSLF